MASLKLVLVGAVACLLYSQAEAYSAGAPEGVCQDMIPRHKTDPQTSKFPYSVRLSKSKINSGDSIDVTVSGYSSDQDNWTSASVTSGPPTPQHTSELAQPGRKNLTFKGLLIQARVGQTPVGRFTIKPEYASQLKLMDCLGGTQNAVTHTSPAEKSEVSLIWTAPPNLKETVVFYTTVAKNGGEFWVAQKSRALTVA